MLSLLKYFPSLILKLIGFPLKLLAPALKFLAPVLKFLSPVLGFASPVLGLAAPVLGLFKSSRVWFVVGAVIGTLVVSGLIYYKAYEQGKTIAQQQAQVELLNIRLEAEQRLRAEAEKRAQIAAENTKRDQATVHELEQKLSEFDQKYMELKNEVQDPNGPCLGPDDVDGLRKLFKQDAPSVGDKSVGKRKAAGNSG